LPLEFTVWVNGTPVSDMRTTLREPFSQERAAVHSAWLRSCCAGVKVVHAPASPATSATRRRGLIMLGTSCRAMMPRKRRVVKAWEQVVV
jgi:hypothetical protein